MRRTVWILSVFVSVAVACSGQADVPQVQPLTLDRHPPLPPGSDDFAHQSFGAPLSIGDAQEILLRTEAFAFGGMPPKRQVQAFNLLLEQRDAVGRFRLVARGAQHAGRFYALCAFWLLSVNEAGPLATDLARTEAKLVVYDHDVIHVLAASEIMSQLGDRTLCEEMKSDGDGARRFFDKAG